MSARTKLVLFWLLLGLGVPSISLLLCELVLRMSSPELASTYGFLPHNPFVPNRYLGWLHLPHETFRYRSLEFDVTFQTNNEGFRSSKPFLASSDTLHTIAILGDSFVESTQVTEPQTFPILVEKSLQKDFHQKAFQVQNYGVSGFGMPHYLQTYSHFARAKKPRFVFISFLDMNDLTDALPENMSHNPIAPAYQYGEDGRIIAIKQYNISAKKPLLSPDSWLRKLYLYSFAKSFFTKPLEETGTWGKLPRGIEIYEQEWNPRIQTAWQHHVWAFRKLVSTIKSEGGKPVLIYMPSTWSSSDLIWQEIQANYKGNTTLIRNRVQDAMQQLAQEMKLPILDLSPVFQQAYQKNHMPHYPKDGHLNVLGHQLVAKEMLNYLKTDSIQVYIR